MEAILFSADGLKRIIIWGCGSQSIVIMLELVAVAAPGFALVAMDDGSTMEISCEP